MTCFSIVMVLHYLYRPAVSALFSLVVLLITYCVVKSHFILLFEQIKKEKKRKRYHLPAGRLAANLPHTTAVGNGTDRQTDGHRTIT